MLWLTSRDVVLGWNNGDWKVQNSGLGTATGIVVTHLEDWA